MNTPSAYAVGLTLTIMKVLILLAFLESHALASDMKEDFLPYLLELPASQCKGPLHSDAERSEILAHAILTYENEDLFLMKEESRVTAPYFILLNSSSLPSFQNPLPIDVVAAFGGGLLATFALLLPCLRSQKKHESKDFPSKGSSVSVSLSRRESSFGCSSSTACSSSSQPPLQRHQGERTFTLADLSRATKKFSPLCKIGQGGFGIVYRGKLEDGTFVAIKRAKKKVYDSRLSTVFENEVDMLLSIDHLNLVKIIGYLDESEERILVVEYVPNGNLREHLDGVHGVTLDLSMRLEICIDVAHALTYLHMYAGKPIIHRDVKPSNILLTEKFRAKVADFGYSRMGPIEIGETHVSTEIKGTTGYLDPEYLKTFQLTEKSDVYSFGIVLLEIVTGRRPIDEKKDIKERVLLRWAFRLFLNGKVMEVLDPRLEKTNAACKVAERVCELAFQCTAPTKQDRPTMKEVAESLWNVRREYQLVSKCEDDKQMQVGETSE